MSHEYIVLYGTLRNNTSQSLEFIRTVELHGFDMFNVGAFPAVVDGVGSILGELYKILDDRVLTSFDMIEGYNPNDHNNPSNLYTRESVVVNEGLAYIYLFNQPVQSFSIIESGDWRKRDDDSAT